MTSVYTILDSCDLERSYRVIRGPCPAAWQRPAQRLGQSGHPGITGHGRTPTASAATHAPVVDRRPQWFGSGSAFDPVQQADMSVAATDRPRRPDTSVSQWLRRSACDTH